LYPLNQLKYSLRSDLMEGGLLTHVISGCTRRLIPSRVSTTEAAKTHAGLAGRAEMDVLKLWLMCSMGSVLSVETHLDANPGSVE
jgi:hypothetical protein